MPSIAALPIPGLVPTVTAKPASTVGNETPSISNVTPISSSVSTSSVSHSVSVSKTSSTATAAPLNAFPGPRFTIDPLSDKSVLEVLNPKTGEVVQQLPTKEALRRYEQSAPAAVQSQAQVGTDLNGQG